MRRAYFVHARAALAALTLAAVTTIVASPHAAAQTPAYPSRPVKLVLPFGPAGSTDVIARLLAKSVGESWGQQIIIENKPGADGDLGAEAVARATADGYTLLLTTQALVVNASLKAKRAYKTEDLAPIMLVAQTQAVLSVPAASPATSVKELIAMAKAAPGKLDYGSAGVGTSGHLAIELFRLTTGIDVVHIPFRNIGQWMTDLIAGRIALGMPTVPGATTHIRSGKIKPLGVSGKTRTKALPEVPTVAEAGVPGYEATTWYALFAPRGTSEAIIARVNAAFRAALDQPEVNTRLIDIGVEPIPTSPAELGNHVASEAARWGKVIAEANIKAE